MNPSSVLVVTSVHEVNGDPGPVLHRPLLVVLQVVQNELNEHQIDHVDPEDVGVVGEDEHQQGVDWLPDKVVTSGAFTSTGSGGHHPCEDQRRQASQKVGGEVGDHSVEVAASAGPVDGHAPVGRPAQLTGGRPAELHLEEEAAEVEPPTAAAALAGREQLREGFGAQGVGGVSGGDDVLAVQPTGVTFEAAVQADATGGPPELSSTGEECCFASVVAELQLLSLFEANNGRICGDGGGNVRVLLKHDALIAVWLADRLALKPQLKSPPLKRRKGTPRTRARLSP
ncbi:hypothetical protein TYRP_006929 [Tyrophagus putrescentiae]|nr:hypothetical protein TYRP_006929 [Tyrophagus putrescentiae]